MGGIFISYRRADTAASAGRLQESLSHHFGADHVFLDVKAINPGERFAGIVRQRIDACNALLAVIGPAWLTVTDATGRRRLDDPKDPVREEIATALRRADLLVIPILIESTPMPPVSELPDELAPLAECNAFSLTHEGWGEQIPRLERELEKVQPTALSSARANSTDRSTAFVRLGPDGLVVDLNQKSRQRALAAERLVEAVRLQWTEEAKTRGLFDPDPMPVKWSLTKLDVSDHIRNIASGPLSVHGSSDRIDKLTQQFLHLSRRRLVILGCPGSGKSTLAVQLLLHLVKTRGPADPVPLLLTANGWDIDAHPRLRDWVVFRLKKDYPAIRTFGESIPGELVDSGVLLPIIDGLDEIDPEHRPALLDTLNTSLGEADPLVLTCRTDEYVDAVDHADVLTAAAVIEAQPLNASDAADYLDGCLPPRQRSVWKPILVALRSKEHTPIAEVCTTPLGVWLLRIVHIENKRDPSPLVDTATYPDAGSIKADLFEHLIPAFISERRPVRDGSDPLRPRHAWDPDATRKWMAQLAIQLDGQRDLRWWDFPSVVPSRILTVMTVLIGVVVPFSVIGLCLGVGLAVFGLRGGPAEAALLGTVGLATGLLSCLPLMPAFVTMIAPGIRKTPEPGYASTRLRGRGVELTRRLANGLIAGLALGLLAGMVGGSTLALMNRFQTVNLANWTSLIAFVASVGVLLYRRKRPASPRDPDLIWNQNAFSRRAGRGYVAVCLVLIAAFALATLIGETGLRHEMFVDMLRLGFLGSAGGLSAGLAIGLARWMRRPGSDDRSRTPISTYRGSRNVMALSVVLFPTIGMVAGVGIAAALAALHVLADAEWAEHAFAGVAIGLWVGSIAGLLIAPMQEPAWLGFVAAARWLAFRRRLPWRITAFLDDTHRLGLLRTVGSVYQFRHAELQDHLAKSQPTRAN